MPLLLPLILQCTQAAVQCLQVTSVSCTILGGAADPAGQLTATSSTNWKNGDWELRELSGGATYRLDYKGKYAFRFLSCPTGTGLPLGAEVCCDQGGDEKGRCGAACPTFTACPTPAPPTAIPTIAPATPAPPTAIPTTAPATPAPPTAIPTDAPATQAPPTAIPTTAPATQAPATAIPTDAPATPAPPTAIPTDAPATPAPPTAIPTDAPATQAPPTAIPTDAPATPAPPTAIPTDAPATPAPPTAIPTDAPATPAPPTAIPTDAPATPAPPTAIPTDAPATPAPPTAIPTDAPATPAPPTAIPTDAPATQAPATAIPTNAPSTSAPPTAIPTVAPPTPAPPTAMPTEAPPTPAPQTAIPTAEPTQEPTFAPETSVSTTEPTAPPTAEPTSTPTTQPATVPPAVPRTGVPVTEAPTGSPGKATAGPTGAPETTGVPGGTSAPTGAPETPAPTTHELSGSATTEAVGAGAASAAGLGAGAAAGTAMRLVLISDSCVIGDYVRQLPWMFHPTRIKIGGSEPAGAVVGNFSIVVGFTLLMKGVMMVAGLFPGVSRFLKTSDPEGFLRFPSAPLFVFQWFYQGTTLSSMLLLFYPPSVLGFLLGVASCLFCTAVPFVVLVSVHRGVPKEAIYRVDTEDRGRLFNFIVGPGEWVSLREERHWVQRWASVTKTYTQHTAWFSFVDFSSSFCLAAMAAFKTYSYAQCGHIKTFQACIFVVLLAIEAKYWPHVRMRDCVTDFVLLGAQTAGLFLMGNAFYNGGKENTAFETAGLLMYMATIILMGKVVLDVFTEAYIFFSGRRRRLQEEEWARDRISFVEADLATSYSRAPETSLSFVSADARNTPTTKTTHSSKNTYNMPKSVSMKHVNMGVQELQALKQGRF